MNIKIGAVSILLFVVGAVCTHAQAQEREGISPDRRLKGGLAFSSLQNTEWETSTNIGFALGLSLDFRFTESFSLQPEVLYLEKGSRERVSGIDTEFDLTMDYVEVPVLAKYHLPAAGIFQPHLYAGPYVSFLIANNANVELVDNSDYTPDQLIREAKDTDFGAVIGVGSNLDFTFNTMSIEVRYSTGLTNAFDSPAAGSFRNGAFIFMVGFGF